jgi:hypothetical protein
MVPWGILHHRGCHLPLIGEVLVERHLLVVCIGCLVAKIEALTNVRWNSLSVNRLAVLIDQNKRIWRERLKPPTLSATSAAFTLNPATGSMFSLFSTAVMDSDVPAKRRTVPVTALPVHFAEDFARLRIHRPIRAHQLHLAGPAHQRLSQEEEDPVRVETQHNLALVGPMRPRHIRIQRPL